MKPRGPSGMDVFDKLAQDAEQIVDEELELEGEFTFLLFSLFTFIVTFTNLKPPLTLS